MIFFLFLCIISSRNTQFQEFCVKSIYTITSNVIDALNVRKTFAVRPGMSSFRWAFNLLVSSWSKRSSPGFLSENYRGEKYLSASASCLKHKKINSQFPTFLELQNCIINRKLNLNRIFVLDRIFTKEVKLH